MSFYCVLHMLGPKKLIRVITTTFTGILVMKSVRIWTVGVITSPNYSNWIGSIGERAAEQKLCLKNYAIL